jgi:4-amino-4-deoxy-L-arabinose transferase-like glycosyltransferase
MIHKASNSVHWKISIGLFLGSLLLIVATLKDYGITWDEPFYFQATDLHMSWMADFGQNVVKGDLNQSFSDENIKAAWHWDPYRVPHPPFSRIVSGITKSITSPWLNKFSGYRLAPALFFAVLVTVMFLWISELFGCATGLFAALVLLLIPNLFGFAHIAVTDMPLASMWFLTAFCFWKGLTDWRWSVALGTVWGLALATKFPALLIPLPLILWSHLFNRNHYANNVFAMLFISPLIMIVTQPYLWHQSGLRIMEFLYEGLSRGYRPETNFAIYFFGQLYSTQQLPFYYPFFLIAVTTPEPILALAIVGVLSIPWLRERASTIVLFMINAFFVLGLGLLPGAVLHDGVRQLLATLPFVAALAGGGFFVLTERLMALAHSWKQLAPVAHLKAKILGIVCIALLFSPSLDLYLCHPFQLSFYNRLVGGIRGAYAQGLEMTYFMEAFTPEFLTALNDRLPPNATVNASFANFMFEYYQKAGSLRSDIRITAGGGSFDYYVLLNRRSTMSPRERFWMNRHFETFLSVRIAGVPLVSVFEFKKSR